jgi:cytochrome c-type biogenesis protein CcmH
MLGRSYFVMNRHADAAKAYAEANTRSASQNADWLVGEGEALAIARDRDLLGRPAQLFEAALALQPGYGKALWYGALADGQSGNTARASERLRRLLQQDLPEELRGIVQARLDEMQGAAPRATAQADPPATAPPAAPAVATGARLVVQVSVAPALAAQLPANATLFVFAKAAGGPPMPLAVQRLPGARLPLTVTLDDSMGMTPAMTLSQFERYVITARLSSSGNAQAVSGDLEGSAEAQRGGDSVVAVEINRTVP